MRRLLLLLLLFLAGTASAQPLPRLTLEQSFARPLPDSFHVSGADLAADGSILLWASNQPYLLHLHGDSASVIRHPALRKPVGAAFLEGGAAVEVVDDDGSVLRITDEGVMMDGRGPSPERFDAAVRLGSGWVMGGAEASGAYRLVRRDAAGGHHPLASLPAPLSGRSAVDLLGMDDHVLVSFRRAPFDIVRVGVDGELTPWPEPEGVLATLDSIAAAASEAPLWVGLRLVALDRGFLRVFADLRSDVRVLALYGRDGDLVRSQILEVPLGPVVGRPDTGELLVARRASAQDLVGYRWRWGDTTNTRDER